MKSFFISSLMSIQVFCLYAQNVLKLRSGISGLDVPVFNSSRLNEEFTIDNPHYSSRKLNKVYPWADFHFFIDFERNQKFTISTGYINSGIGAGFKYIYKTEPQYYISPEGFKYPFGSGYGNFYSSYTIHKIPLIFSYRIFDNRNQCREINHKKLFIQPDLLTGVSLMLMGNNFDKYISYDIPIENQFVNHNNDSITLNYTRMSYNKTGVGLMFGMNLRLKNQNHEFCTLTAYYEQGLIYLLSLEQIGTINNEFKFVDNVSSLGSAFSLRLTFPVFSYNFTQKKFYRD